MRLALICISLSLHLLGQRPVDPDKILAFNITVNYEDHTVKTQMLKDPKKIKVDNDLSYLWFSSNKILETKGGYDGKLLHGYYRSFYLNNQLRESGEVKFGVKHGEWRNWYSDGRLKEVSTWKKGKKNGKYELYNDYGQLMAKGCFKDNCLHGKFYTYDVFGKVSDIKKYKYGVEQISKPKKQKVKKETKQNKSEKQSKTNEKKVDPGRKTLKERLKSLFSKKKKSDSKDQASKEK